AGIDKRTGKNLWKSARSKDISWVTPIVIHNHGRDEAIFQSANELTAYDPATGKKHWTYKPAGLTTIPCPAASNDLLLAPGGGVIALRLQPDQKTATVAWQSSKLGTYCASPLYFQERVYAINSASVLNCAEVEKGNVVWQHRLKGQFSASPVAAE